MSAWTVLMKPVQTCDTPEDVWQEVASYDVADDAMSQVARRLVAAWCDDVTDVSAESAQLGAERR